MTATVTLPPPAEVGAAAVVPPGRGERALTAACAVLGLSSVAALLAWVFGLGSFAAWFWSVSAPGMALLAVIAVLVHRSTSYGRLRSALVAGTLGGLLGTLGYDLVRVPFAVLGMRVLAPIDSYGVLLLGSESSSGWTGFAGWAYHFANGVGFGVAYAAVALGRRWWWALAWAMALETATVVTPFAGAYGLTGKWGFIAVAYGAHVAYGTPLGRVVQDHTRWRRQAGEVTARSATAALAATVGALLLWHQPWSVPDRLDLGRGVGSGPRAVVADGTLSPQWLRVPVGGCAVLANTDDRDYVVRGAGASATLRSGEQRRLCFPDGGVHRLRTSGAPYAGGFVIVDPELPA